MSKDTKGTALTFFLTRDTIAGIQIRSVRGKIEIIAYGALPTPIGTMDGASILNPTSLGQAIRALMRQMGIEAKTASIALPSPGYSMRPMRLPEVPPKERRTLIRSELEQVAAIPLGNGAFDFLWGNAAVGEGKKQVEVYAYYVTDALVEGVIETFHHARLELKGIEAASIAMIRAYLYGLPQQRPIAFLCPAEKHSDLCIHDGLQVQHIRRIPAGWADLIPQKQVTIKRGLNYEEEPASPFNLYSESETTHDYSNNSGMAQTAVLPEIGFAQPEGEFGQEEEVPLSDMPHLTQSATFLISEVTRSLAFYTREHSPESVPQEFVILGSAERVQEFQFILAGQLPLALSTHDPLEAFGLAGNPSPSSKSESLDMAYLASIGAGLIEIGIEASLPRINISKQETQAASRRRAPNVMLVGMAGSTLWMLAAAVGAISLNIMEGNAQNEKGRIEQETKKIQNERIPLLRYQEILNAATKAQDKAQLPAGPVMGRIAASSTFGVAVTGINVSSDGKVAIDGKALDYRTIQRFANSLGEGKAIKTPRFEMMKKDPKEGLTFRLVGLCRAAPPPVVEEESKDKKKE